MCYACVCVCSHTCVRHVCVCVCVCVCVRPRTQPLVPRPPRGEVGRQLYRVKAFPSVFIRILWMASLGLYITEYLGPLALLSYLIASELYF
ncbi:mCG147765 [Mus musculus]|nr:mCG147765 [Mus musculus]